MRKHSLPHRVHHYFFPHKHNGYRPHIFRVASVAVIALAIVVLEGAYLTQIKFVFPHTSFLGAVLPGALVALTNDDRAANDVPAVSENAQLAQAAQDAANDMATKGYFAHISPDGKDPWHWLNLVGYKYQYAGENLAVDFTDSSAVESAWMASPEHHANIVKPQYTQIGIGTANGMYQGKEATFVVQFFASPEITSSQGSATAAGAPKVATVAPSPSVSPEKGAVAPVAAVLGTQAQVPAISAISSSIANFFALVSTSPTSTVTHILSVLAIIIFILLIIAIVVKIGVQFIEIIAGGLLLLLIILGLLFFNARNAPKVQVSVNNYSVAIGS
ncbi:MAG: CAP domain-containing protein [Minisyncoccia bacterium]|jgi:hypothetical protein